MPSNSQCAAQYSPSMGSSKGFGRRPSREAKVNPLSVECVALKTSSLKLELPLRFRSLSSSTMNLATIGPFLCFEKPLLTGYRVSSTSKMSVSTALPVCCHGAGSCAATRG